MPKPTTTMPGEAGRLEQAFETLKVDTRGPGLWEQTAVVADWLGRIGAADGLLTLFIRHTSASLLIQENADPDVHTDLIAALERLAPRDGGYVHDVEGPDDMPAHIKSALTATSLSIPVSGGRCCSAPGRASTSSSTATVRTAARWCCTSPARSAARRAAHQRGGARIIPQSSG